MKYPKITAIFMCISSSLGADQIETNPDAMRTFFSKDGREIRAKVTDATSETVTFERADGQFFRNVSLSTLRIEDQTFIKEWVWDRQVDAFFTRTFVIDGVMGDLRNPAIRDNRWIKTEEGNDQTLIKSESGISTSVMSVSTEESLDAQVEAIERGAFKNVRLIRKYSDIIQCQNDGWNGILTYKQLDEWPSSGRLEIPMIADWKARGLRIFQLSYAVTDRSSEDVRASRLGHAGFQKGGLTDLGREVVEELNRLNMVVDVSHCNDETVIETCARSTSPVIASHANALAISPSGRNKGDEALLAIKRSGGLIGVTPVGWMFENPETKDRSISQLVNHMDHIRKVIGTEHLAVASDSHYDGWPVDSPNYACPQLAAPRRWKHVAKEMLRRGYTEEDLEKVFSTNWLRILKATLQP